MDLHATPRHRADAVVVTGVPGAGKSTLARALAEGLGAPFLSLDAIKEELYERDIDRGAGYRLRRSAEIELGRCLSAAEGVVVVDIWVAPGRDTGRVAELLTANASSTVEVLCRVPAEVAVARYLRRFRGGPHRPADQDTLRRIRAAVAVLTPLGAGRCIEVDTSGTVDIDQVLARLRS